MNLLPIPSTILYFFAASGSIPAPEAPGHGPVASALPSAPAELLSYDAFPTAGSLGPLPPHEVDFDPDAWYLRFSGGLVTTSDADGPGEEIDFDEGLLLALALGHHFGAEEGRVGFDLELEGTWSEQDTEGDLAGTRDYTAASLLLNALLELRLVRSLFLYGGAGLGAAFVDVDTSSGFDEEDGPFLTWQVKAGFLVRASRSVSLNLGYRFVNINDIEIIDSIGTDNFDLGIEQHVIELGLGFSF